MPPRPIPNTNKIGMFLHCGLCLDEWKAGKASGQSPGSYQRVNVGYTQQGIQVWCTRHDCNVIHIDFAGQNFHANDSRLFAERTTPMHPHPINFENPRNPWTEAERIEVSKLEQLLFALTTLVCRMLGLPSEGDGHLIPVLYKATHDSAHEPEGFYIAALGLYGFHGEVPGKNLVWRLPHTHPSLPDTVITMLHVFRAETPRLAVLQVFCVIRDLLAVAPMLGYMGQEHREAMQKLYEVREALGEDGLFERLQALGAMPDKGSVAERAKRFRDAFNSLPPDPENPTPWSVDPAAEPALAAALASSDVVGRPIPDGTGDPRAPHVTMAPDGTMKVSFGLRGISEEELRASVASVGSDPLQPFAAALAEERETVARTMARLSPTSRAALPPGFAEAYAQTAAGSLNPPRSNPAENAARLEAEQAAKYNVVLVTLANQKGVLVHVRCCLPAERQMQILHPMAVPCFNELRAYVRQYLYQPGDLEYAWSVRKDGKVIAMGRLGASWADPAPISRRDATPADVRVVPPPKDGDQ
jgi:hypothetical protein